MNVKEMDAAYIAPTYARFPLEIARGKGSLAWDENGGEYIDLGAGIAVNTFGYADDIWRRAVTDQLSRVQHASNLYYTAPCAELAKMLCERTGMKRVFFSNSGAEANECAIKAARKYASDTKGADWFTVLTLKNSFHGRTLTTLAATGQDAFHAHFQPLTPGFVHAEANNLDDALRKIDENKLAGIMIEIVQGEGGVVPLTREFAQGLANIAAERNIPLIVDEVQTGNGRTGQLFAYMNYDLSPDIVTTAKGLGGGLPLGATMLSDKMSGVFAPGLHGSTFGGNPICCAGAISVLSRIDDALLAGVREKSALIRASLEGAKGVRAITGMGLMIGIETTGDAAKLAKQCLSRGVLVLTAHGKLRLLPALNIPVDLLKKALDVIKTVCAEEENL